MPYTPGQVERTKLSGETLPFMQRMWDLAHALAVRSKHMAKTLGVTGPQRLVVRVLGRSPEMTARDIAETLGMHPSTLTGILSRLASRGILERKIDGTDRRRARFHLTALGKKIDRERKGTVEAAVRRALARADASTIAKASLMLTLLAEELSKSA
jgi:DNA-binding MarR family transcriptional regulator